MEHIGWFIFSFIFVYIIYYFLFIKRSKRKDKIPSEAQYLINLYKLDIKKFSYHKFMMLIGIIVSLDVSLATTIVTVVNGFVWQLAFGFLAVVPITVISFMLIGKYYQSKQKKDNSKELAKEKKYLEKLKKKEEKLKKKQSKVKTKKIKKETI